MAAMTPARTTPGISGRLYRYRLSPNALQAFESPEVHNFSKFCVYLGGLTDGLLACQYVDSLASECQQREWALVQPIISSSYLGYGTGSLGRDTGELSELLEFLVRERGCKDVALVGHSTGCQNAVHFMRNAPAQLRNLVRVVGLQAPVSDREAAILEQQQQENSDHENTIDALLQRSRQMVEEGRGNEIIFMQYGFAPISAYRYLSLNDRRGDDDLFSSDFSDAELAELLGHMSTAGQHILDAREFEQSGSAGGEGLMRKQRTLSTLLAFSMDDEYVLVPPEARSRHVQRLVAAMSHHLTAAIEDGKEHSEERQVRALELAEANHNLSKPPHASGLFIKEICSLLEDAT